MGEEESTEEEFKKVRVKLVIIESVITQIQKDIEDGDTKCIYEMLTNLSDDCLLSYLPEEKALLVLEESKCC